MKTPRELLLARHRAVEPKLDARRQRVIAFLSSKAAVAPSSSADLLSDQGLWRSMVSSRLAVFSAWLRQLRWHLAGMAAVWMSVAILNGIDRPSTPRFA